MKSLLYFNTDTSDFANLQVKGFRENWLEKFTEMVETLMNKPNMYICGFGFGGLSDLKGYSLDDKAIVANIIDRVKRGWCYHVLVHTVAVGMTGQITHSFTIDEHE